MSTTERLGDLADQSTCSSSFCHIVHSGSCLLPLLQPVKHCLHTFLSARDAVCLMRASRSITTTLLPGYSIVDRHHAERYDSRTAADIKRSIALFAHYGMRIRAMCLPDTWDEPLTDPVSGRSVLPSSLIAFTLGAAHVDASNMQATMLDAALDSNKRRIQQMTNQLQSSVDENEEQFYLLMRHVGAETWGDAWSVSSYPNVAALFNHPIPPGALPRGLRFLQLNLSYNQPLQVGSIPDTVEVLQFGACFNQPLAIGYLPSSLTHLNFDATYNHPLLPGVLPSSLKRLSLGYLYNHPLLPGVLPSKLRELCLSCCYNCPIASFVIPSSVTHLRLSRDFNQPLQVGSIPEGVRHLNFGDCFNQPLLPGVLPTSLRELIIGQQFNHTLRSDSLPDGLEVLAFDSESLFDRSLQPGVIPASVKAVSMGVRYVNELIAGGIPASVVWLRLPNRYADRNLTGALSASTRVVWHVL